MYSMNHDNEHKSSKPECKKTVIHRYATMALTVLFFCSIVGCHGSDDDPVTVSKVLLVYLASDNNLSSEGYEKLQAIASGYDGALHSRILIYLDSPDESACLYQADGKGAYSLIENYGDENSANATVFSRVIHKVKSMYPQASFNLLAFSHASGWLPAGSFSNPSLRSILVDGDNQMDFKDFVDAIPDGMFDLIAFDACHMAGIEVAYQLRNKTKYIAAASAEILSPGFTPIYEKHVVDLLSDNYRQFMQQVFAYYNSKTGYMRSATLSIIKTEGLHELTEFVKDNCDFTKKVQPADIQHFDRGTGYLFCDFGDYYSLLLDTDQQRQQLQRIIENCVIWKAATPSFLEGYSGFAIISHSGLTSYIPQDRYPKLNSSYTELDWFVQAGMGAIWN